MKRNIIITILLAFLLLFLVSCEEESSSIPLPMEEKDKTSIDRVLGDVAAEINGILSATSSSPYESDLITFLNEMMKAVDDEALIECGKTTDAFYAKVNTSDEGVLVLNNFIINDEANNTTYKLTGKLYVDLSYINSGFSSNGGYQELIEEDNTTEDKVSKLTIVQTVSGSEPTTTELNGRTEINENSLWKNKDPLRSAIEEKYYSLKYELREKGLNFTLSTSFGNFVYKLKESKTDSTSDAELSLTIDKKALTIIDGQYSGKFSIVEKERKHTDETTGEVFDYIEYVISFDLNVKRGSITDNIKAEISIVEDERIMDDYTTIDINSVSVNNKTLIPNEVYGYVYKEFILILRDLIDLRK